MNIAILSRSAQLYSTKSLLDCGLKHHNMEVMDPTLCHIGTKDNKAVLYYGTEIVDDLDAVIPRIGASNTYFGSSLVRHFESMSVFSTVSAEAILQSRNKWTCQQILSQHSIPTPTSFLGHTTNPDEVLIHFGGRPVVIKLLQGTHGQGVILAESTASARSIMETLNASKVRFLVQEYIAESKGSDLRAIVVDGAVDAPDTLGKMLGAARFEALREAKGKDKDGLLLPEQIAETYYHLSQQHRSAWTHELDLRAYSDLAWWNHAVNI